MTHTSSVGCPNEGEVFRTATTGRVETQEAAIESPDPHNHEAASPGYYEVCLQRWNVKAERTAADRYGHGAVYVSGGQGSEHRSAHQPYTKQPNGR